MAAALVAGLLGCGTEVQPGDDGSGDGTGNGDGPDAGVSNTSGVTQCEADVCLDLLAEANASLRTVGGQRVISVGSKKYLVIRTAEDAFVAVSALCTHRSCVVGYSKTRNDIVCPCHGSTFALSGAVTRGPATLPLRSYETRFDQTSEVLTIVLS